MDSLKPRKKIISAGDGMVPRKNVSISTPSGKHVSNHDVTQGDPTVVSEVRYKYPQELQFKPKIRHSSLWKNVSVLVMCSLLSLCTVGFLYSRAVIEITPESYYTNLVRTFTVANRLSTETVHGIWLDASGRSSSHTENSLYPAYVPLAKNSSDGSVIVISRVNIMDIIMDDIAKEFSHSEFEVVDISISKPVFDSYVFVSRPDSFVVNAEIRVFARQVLDVDTIRQECYYKPLIPSASDLSQCLLDSGGIAHARLIVHPWFALRTPIARAIDVEIVE
jgi:hypothetical protein